jgi:hypothetical protein
MYVYDYMYVCIYMCMYVYKQSYVNHQHTANFRANKLCQTFIQ